MNVKDATAFGEQFRNDGSPLLIDLNGDGAVDVRDATAFGGRWAQWSDTVLPVKP